MIVKGRAKKISEQQSDNYFDSRPLGSRLGAIVSNQSEVIESYEGLAQALKVLEDTAVENQVKRPKHWGDFVWNLLV